MQWRLQQPSPPTASAAAPPAAPVPQKALPELAQIIVGGWNRSVNEAGRVHWAPAVYTAPATSIPELTLVASSKVTVVAQGNISVGCISDGDELPLVELVHHHHHQHHQHHEVFGCENTVDHHLSRLCQSIAADMCELSKGGGNCKGRAHQLRDALSLPYPPAWLGNQVSVNAARQWIEVYDRHESNSKQMNMLRARFMLLVMSQRLGWDMAVEVFYAGLVLTGALGKELKLEYS